MSVHLPEAHCLSCGQMVDASTSMGSTGQDERPLPGSFSVCGFCGVLAMFDENLQIAPLDNEHVEYLLTHPEDLRLLTLAQKACVMMRSMRN